MTAEQLTFLHSNGKVWHVNRWVLLPRRIKRLYLIEVFAKFLVLIKEHPTG